MTITEALNDQFTRLWAMYREAIENYPREQWRASDVDYLIPARIVYHVLEAAEFYASDERDNSLWGARFGGDSELLPPEKLPLKKDLLKYLDEVERQLIRVALEQHGGVVRRAARQLGMNAVTLGRKARRHGLV